MKIIIKNDADINEKLFFTTFSTNLFYKTNPFEEIN